MPRTKIPLEIRFWSKVDKTGSCWLWTAGCSGDGYGQIKIDGHQCKPHRIAYELLVGPIPEGMHIDHLCRIPTCVRPEHLEAVSQRVNILRGIGATACHARQTHCKRGHAFDEANTYIWRSSRICRKCRLEYVGRNAA